MKINRHNYELFFIDYLDGNLSDQEIRMIEDFLLINPDLRPELEGTEKIILNPENIEYLNKNNLKKPDLSFPVNEDNFEDFCIGSAEKDLNDEQYDALLKYITQHPESEKIFKLYNNLHLLPDPNIIYFGKENLKKRIIFIPGQILYPLVSVAAAAALMIFLYVSNEYKFNQLQNITSELPASVITKSASQTNNPAIKSPIIQEKNPVIQQASVIDFNISKETKRTVEKKKNVVKDSKGAEDKEKNRVPVQKLNPTIQIKLPSLADNDILIPAIEKGKITYSSINSTVQSPQFLSLSEYARKQLAEKVLYDTSGSFNKITGWQIADAGIKGINKLTGSEMKMERKTDLHAAVSTYSFNSKIFSFSRTTSR